MAYPKYNDGLDDDGYPIDRPQRQPYIHGSESEGLDFEPIRLGDALSAVIDRCAIGARIGDSTDSPIEQHLGASILLVFERRGKPLKLCLEMDPAVIGLLLVPQFKWSIYRSDWAIYNTKTTGALLIECDGAAFHSTAEQVVHDRKKDSAAHDRGYLTMRFTGSEIHKDADGCARKIFDFVYGGRK